MGQVIDKAFGGRVLASEVDRRVKFRQCYTGSAVCSSIKVILELILGKHLLHTEEVDYIQLQNALESRYTVDVN